MEPGVQILHGAPAQCVAGGCPPWLWPPVISASPAGVWEVGFRWCVTALTCSLGSAEVGGVLVSPGWHVAAGLGEGGHPASGESQDAC